MFGNVGFFRWLVQTRIKCINDISPEEFKVYNVGERLGGLNI